MFENFDSEVNEIHNFIGKNILCIKDDSITLNSSGKIHKLDIKKGNFYKVGLIHTNYDNVTVSINLQPPFYLYEYELSNFYDHFRLISEKEWRIESRKRKIDIALKD